MINLNELDKMVDTKSPVMFECDSHWMIDNYTTIFSSVRTVVDVPFSYLSINPSEWVDGLVVEAWRGRIATMGFNEGKYSVIKSEYGSLFKMYFGTYMFIEHKSWKEKKPEEFKNIMELFFDKGPAGGEIIRPCFRNVLPVNLNKLIKNQNDEDLKNYDYHESEKLYLGDSDMGEIMISGIEEQTQKLKHHILCFGEDGSYYAHFIDQTQLNSQGFIWKCPSYYEKIISFLYLVYIQDDHELVKDLEVPAGKRLNIYRSGLRGCIFELEDI